LHKNKPFFKVFDKKKSYFWIQCFIAKENRLRANSDTINLLKFVFFWIHLIQVARIVKPIRHEKKCRVAATKLLILLKASISKISLYYHKESFYQHKAIMLDNVHKVQNNLLNQR
jgi:hypothetical protein